MIYQLLYFYLIGYRVSIVIIQNIDFEFELRISILESPKRNYFGQIGIKHGFWVNIIYAREMNDFEKS